MGYDMYIRDDHGLTEEERYFRLNIWGMQKYRGHMLDIGMVFDGEHPDWPDPEQYGTTYEQVDIVRYPDDAEGRELTDAHDEALARHGPKIPGIPLHKFGSNDGWIVTAAECEAAYRIAQGQPAPETEYDDQDEENDYWNKWLGFLKLASRRNGFVVY